MGLRLQFGRQAHVAEALAAVVFVETKLDKQEILVRFLALINAMHEADEQVTWSEDNLRWFVELLDSDAARTVLSLLLAFASAHDEWLTPAEIAGMTNTAESGWRNKAAAGEIPGAYKKGKQWLIPAHTLRALGILRE